MHISIAIFVASDFLPKTDLHESIKRLKLTTYCADNESAFRHFTEYLGPNGLALKKVRTAKLTAKLLVAATRCI